MILTKVETRGQVHMAHKASLEITWANWDVLKIFFIKLPPSLTSNSADNLRLYAQVQRERDHFKMLSKKPL